MSAEISRLARALVLLAALGGGPVLAATEPYYQPHYCNNAFTYEQEIAVGKKAAQQVYKQMKVLPDSSPITQYVQSVGAKLVAYAPGYKWPYNFHVVQDRSINAFALPGGPIFINTGLIAAAQNESELAGVMAHEISHVVQRHATCNMTKQSKRNVGWGLAGVLAGVLVPGAGGVLAQQGVGMAQNLSYLQMSRTDEKEADLLGTEILWAAGYNPRGLVQMFQIIEKQTGSGGAQFLSDHPNPGNRVQYVDKEIQALPPKPNAINNTPEFMKIRAMVESNKEMAGRVSATSKPPAPSSRKAPAQSGNIIVSSQTVLFQHQGYSIRYPANWKLYGDSGSIVTIAPPGGIVTDSKGQAQVAYGVIIDSFQPDQGSTLAEGTRQLIARLRQSNPQLRETGSAEEINVDGMPARSVELESLSPLSTGKKTITEQDWLVTVARSDGQIGYFVFIAPQPDFRTLRPAYTTMLHSVQLSGTNQDGN
jgi:hypothetical protein